MRPPYPGVEKETGVEARADARDVDLACEPEMAALRGLQLLPAVGVLA
jgi:hypothetical protein